MIRTFGDRGTRDVFEAADTKKARAALPSELWQRARVKLDQIDAASAPRDLLTRSNRLHPLSGDREGQLAIRINRQYRICFRWEGADAWDVEITDYH